MILFEIKKYLNLIIILCISIELEVKNNKWTRIEKNTCIGPES